MKVIFPIPPATALPTFRYGLEDPIEKPPKVQFALLLGKLLFIVKKYKTTALLITNCLGKAKPGC